jgi:hypothetical protein
MTDLRNPRASWCGWHSREDLCATREKPVGHPAFKYDTGTTASHQRPA